MARRRAFDREPRAREAGVPAGRAFRRSAAGVSVSPSNSIASSAVQVGHLHSPQLWWPVDFHRTLRNSARSLAASSDSERRPATPRTG